MLAWLEDGDFESYKKPQQVAPGAYSMEVQKKPNEVIRVGQIMNPNLITVDVGATAEEALELMISRDIHHLPVLSDNVLVGLVSDRDLYDTEDRNDTLVEEVMTLRLLTAREDSAIWTVGQIMLIHRINCVLVVSEEQMLLGLLTSLDILACMTYQAPIEVWG